MTRLLHHLRFSSARLWAPLTLALTAPACRPAVDRSDVAPIRPASIAASDDAALWPGFRGPTGLGVSDAESLPLTWSDSENILWKTPLPGPGASSPIVYGEHVYLTCYSGYFVPDEPEGTLEDLRRHLIAVRRADGEIAWQRESPAKLPEESRIRDHGYAANTPVADELGVYAFFGKSGVHAFSHAGDPLWGADVGAGTHGWGSGASPVLHENLLIVNASVESQSLVALDRSTGEEIWRVGGIVESWNTPVLVEAASGRRELIVAVHGKVLAFAPDSGETLWSCDTDIDWYMVPSVVAADGVVYCLGGRSGVASLAVRAGGSGDVTATHRLWTSRKGSNVSSPVVLGEYLFWAHDQGGVAHCALTADGQTVYQERMRRAGQIYSASLAAAGRIYYLSRDGRTFVVSARPEFEQLAVNELSGGGRFNGSPAVAGDRLLIRSDKFLYCIADGE